MRLIHKLVFHIMTIRMESIKYRSYECKYLLLQVNFYIYIYIYMDYIYLLSLIKSYSFLSYILEKFSHIQNLILNKMICSLT